MFSLNKIIFVSFCIAIGLTVGCGAGNKMKVSGTVTFSDDGSPLTVGTVVMESATTRVMGELNDKGFYSVGELTDGDGIPFGEYRVTIAGSREQIPGGLPGPYIIDPKHEQPTSGLTFEAKKGGPKTFDFKVDRPPKE